MELQTTNQSGVVRIEEEMDVYRGYLIEDYD